MRCEFCTHNVVGHPNVVSIPGQGIAHQNCFIAYQFHRRIFHGINLSKLCEDGLRELEDLVKTERNARKPDSDSQAIELF